MITKAIKKAFHNAQTKGWEKTYWAFDIQRKYFSVLFLLMPFSFYSYSQTIKDSIRWGTKELTWDDYKGRPNSQSAAMTMSVIHLGIEYPSKKEALITIEAMFKQTSSWTQSKTIPLLVHEKGHFDIAELFARKLRKEIMTKYSKEDTFEDELFTLHKKYCIAMDNYQDQYDNETDFSRNIEKQKTWNTLINNQLEELKEYSSHLNKFIFK
jgi:predicted secreted Zn-dependent protease